MNTLALQDALGGACCSGWFVNTLALQDALGGGMLFGMVCEYPCPSGCIGGMLFGMVCEYPCPSGCFWGHAVRGGL